MILTTSFYEMNQKILRKRLFSKFQLIPIFNVYKEEGGRATNKCKKFKFSHFKERPPHEIWEYACKDR